MLNNVNRRDNSRQLLLDTALKLFSEKGYEATSIRAIAKEGGISLGLMYNYFSSKEELLKEIFLIGQSDIEASFESDQAGMAGTPGIEHHILNMVKLLKEKYNFWRLLHSLRMQRMIITELMASIQQQVDYIQKMIEKNLNEVGYKNAEQEAILLFATLDGMASHYLLNPSYPIDSVANYLIKKYKTQQI